jgi:hypothetical protein
MFHDFLTKWGGWAAILGILVAFIATIGIAVIQPRNTFKWFLLTFSFIPLCIGALCMLGGWQHLHRGDAAAARTAFIIGGVLGCLFAGLFGLSLSIVQQPAPPEQPPGLDACTRHARWISLSGFAGFIAAAFGAFGLMKLALPHPWATWALPLSFAVFSGGPAAFLIFFLPPRCDACKTGRMRFKGSRPVWYRCKSCGQTVHTHIMLGSRPGR